MSDKEETNEEELNSGAQSDAPQEEVDEATGDASQDETSNQAPEETSIMYGTRNRRPGAPTSPAAKTLDQIRGAYEDDDIIEMDDLVVKSTAPSDLVGNERSDSPPKRRERRDRDDRAEVDESESEDAELEAYPSDSTSDATDDQEDRPKRFDSVDKSVRSTQRPVEEFSPSKDGKRAEPKKRAPRDPQGSRPPRSQAKKGFFAWLKSLFTSEPEKPERKRDGRRPNQRRRRRGGQNRGKEGEFKGDRPNRNRGNRRSNRNRRPRGEGENSGNREGGGRRRPQENRKQAPSE